MASSQDTFFHLPSTSLVGYFRRLSPWPCSRIAAPLAQCAPLLNGWSKAGSWPVQTPFWTSAIMPQPTEQWVQTVFTCFIWPSKNYWLGLFSSLPATRLMPVLRHLPLNPSALKSFFGWLHWKRMMTDQPVDKNYCPEDDLVLQLLDLFFWLIYS